LQVPRAFFERPLQSQVAEADRLLALHLWDRNGPGKGRDLAPLPVLGVPGWWAENNRGEFYDDTGYFRPGRRADPDQAASSM